jgi:pyruvate formate lyase activating enzyme
VHEAGCHLEITNLLIPTLNDKMDELNEMVDWIASLSPDIPLHFSRYFPQYKMDIEVTPVETMLAAYEAAGKKLKNVYLGNVATSVAGNDTKCPKCKKSVIERAWPDVKVTGLKGGACAHCGEKIYGRF